ncbi:Ada metal-binding domain-containing protein [Arthrobacter agilis]|uniref:Ada metal-binding domain-containing protein n=1 Tax=Arthrobacter agilis TaxID=37921 RepID=UPI00278B4AD4|nr:Ada metal-binding domain-containing protein [Arthrobacter agilis]MDQ0734292.1 AraC family transcriptional regulator of adaptative response / DNA-3-methyladenine glycosylase II [Arthrobacter agilis]
MDFWQQYRAIDARDVRFDGQFVTAVSSTGIYCRPSCPARTPKPSNVTFYRTSAAAHEAGYRACKRCLPEAVPGDPEWNLRSDAAARAMRLIADGEVDRAGVAGLAARLGYSARHLNRILKDELGAGALSLARAHRAQTARALLTASTLRFSDVAFAAGFGSIRQFNDTVQQVFDLTPGQLRDASRQLRGHAGEEAASGGPLRIPLFLPTRLPYDNGIFRFLAARAVEGVEQAGGSGYERLLHLPAGPAWFRAGAVEARGRGQAALPVTVSVAGLGDLPALLSRIRRLFDLDADPVAIDAALRRHPTFARLTAATPGLRLPGSVDPHETLVRAIVGQQVTVAAARTALGRLATAGPAVEAPGTGLSRMFPSAQDLAEAPEPLLRGPRRRNDALRAAVHGLASGSLEIGVGARPETLRAELLQLPGIGPWTADYVTMRVLGHPDTNLPTDAAVRLGWRLAGRDADRPDDGVPAPSGPSLADAMDTVRPWRSYATVHLWREAGRRTARTGGGAPLDAVA